MSRPKSCSHFDKTVHSYGFLINTSGTTSSGERGSATSVSRVGGNGTGRSVVTGRKTELGDREPTDSSPLDRGWFNPEPVIWHGGGVKHPVPAPSLLPPAAVRTRRGLGLTSSALNVSLSARFQRRPPSAGNSMATPQCKLH